MTVRDRTVSLTTIQLSLSMYTRIKDVENFNMNGGAAGAAPTRVPRLNCTYN